ncbi:fimbrial protein [Salmonella enterica]|nr:fimbrial protein [Salmonella enterica]
MKLNLSINNRKTIFLLTFILFNYRAEAQINGWGNPANKVCTINVSGTTEHPVFNYAGCATSFVSQCYNDSHGNYRYIILGYNDTNVLNSDHSLRVGGLDIKAVLLTPSHSPSSINFGEAATRSYSGDWGCVHGQVWEGLSSFNIKFAISPNELGLSSATDFYYDTTIGYYLGVYATSPLSLSEINSFTQKYGVAIHLRGTLAVTNSCNITPVGGVVEFNFQTISGDAINSRLKSAIGLTCPKTAVIRTQFVGFRNQEKKNDGVYFTDNEVGEVRFKIEMPEFINVEGGVNKREFITATLLSAPKPGYFTASGILITTYE